MADGRGEDRDRPLVIINPKAGGGIDPKKQARLATAVTEGLGAVDFRLTEAQGHASDIAREAAAAGRRLVVALGGDGTISEVVSGLLAARASGAQHPANDTELGIIHRGTGGDFRRTLELPNDVAEAARHVRDRPGQWVDAGQAEFTTSDGKTARRPFINVASFGFSSAVAARANDSAKTWGAKAAFLGATLRTLASYQNQEVMLEIDGAPPVRRTVMLAAVGNGRYFGGGMKICPDAQLDSASMSFVVVGDLGKLKVLTNIHKLFSGTHLTIDDVSGTTIRKLRAYPVEPDLVIPVEMDGETPGRLPATFEVIPRALRIRF